MHRLTFLLALLLAIALSGCGGDDEETTPTAVQTTTVTQPPPTTEPDATTSPDTATPPDTTGGAEKEGCADAAGNEIEVVTGDVDCADAQAAAAQYDAQGERVQQVGSFTCEGGNAATRPVIFTCTGPDGEFVVREAGG